MESHGHVASRDLSPERPSRSELRQKLADHFSRGELRTLCFDLGISYENLPATLDDMTRELVAYCERYARIFELVTACKRLRPNVSWEDTSAPRLLPSHWIAYFEGILSDQDIAEAQRIEAYQKLFTTLSKPLRTVVDEFLTTTLQMLIITGAAGSGKSAFVQQLVRDWAVTGQVAMKEVIQREEFVAPTGWIPIYYSLRGREIADQQKLSAELVNRVNRSGNFWQEGPSVPERIFEYPHLKWLICLDGLDEIWQHEWRERCLVALRSFLDRFPQVKVILTARRTITGLVPTRWQAVKAEIAGFSFAQIISYVSNFVRDEQYDEIIKVLESESDLRELCSIPACLEAAMKELAGVYPASLQSGALADGPPIFAQVSLIQVGALLDRIYQYLWRREAERRPLPAGFTDEWWEATGHLAVRIDGRLRDFRRSTARNVLGSEECLYWITHLGILDHVMTNKWRFYTELTKEYFAASFLRPLVEEKCYDEAHQFVSSTTEDFQRRLRSILSELMAEDTSPLFEGGSNEHSSDR